MQLQFVNVGDIFKVSGNDASGPYHYLNQRDHVEVVELHPRLFETATPWVRVKSLTSSRVQWIKIKHLKNIL